jgi:hypothetical protein
MPPFCLYSLLYLSHDTGCKRWATRLLWAFEMKGKSMQNEVAEQIAALNKADLLFRLAEWHYLHAPTEQEQRHYTQTSLFAATMRAQKLNWLEEHQIPVVRQYGEYVQLSQV